MRRFMQIVYTYDTAVQQSANICTEQLKVSAFKRVIKLQTH